MERAFQGMKDRGRFLLHREGEQERLRYSNGGRMKTPRYPNRIERGEKN
jgi:hypothetical protein